MNETWATNHGDRVIVFQRLTVLGTKWRYQVIAANGELVEHGESYSRRIDAVAAAERHHPRVEVGRCGAPAPSFVPESRPVYCALPAEHVGWHKGDPYPYPEGIAPEWSP